MDRRLVLNLEFSLLGMMWWVDVLRGD